MPSLLERLGLQQVPLPALVGAALFMVLIAAGLATDVMILLAWRRRPPDWRALAGRLLARPWDAPEAGLLLTLLFTMQILVVALVQIALQRGILPEKSLAPWGMILQTVVFEGGGLALVLAARRARGCTWGEGFGVSRTRLARDVRLAAVCYAAAVPFFLLAAVLTQLVLHWFHLPREHQLVVNFLIGPDHPAWVAVYTAIVACVWAPVAEELVFRGVALPAAFKRLGTGFGLCAVSLLFAGMHMHLPSLLPLFVMGMAFALGYLYTGSIVTPIVMHALFNGVNIAVIFVLKDTPLVQ